MLFTDKQTDKQTAGKTLPPQKVAEVRMKSSDARLYRSINPIDCKFLWCHVNQRNSWYIGLRWMIWYSKEGLPGGRASLDCFH